VPAYNNFSQLSLWIFNENYCYCVKYVRFLLFLIFYISQGSVATRLRCGGKYNNSFAANFLLSLAVKEFLKWWTFPKVMPKNRDDSLTVQLAYCYCIMKNWQTVLVVISTAPVWHVSRSQRVWAVCTTDARWRCSWPAACRPSWSSPTRQRVQVVSCQALSSQVFSCFTQYWLYVSI